MMGSNSTLPGHQVSQFFTSESAKLSSLLDVVTAEAGKTIDTPCRDQYIELANIVNDLLGQAQAFSSLAPDELKGRWLDVQLFVGRSQAVQNAVVEWQTTSTTTNQKVACKKRARSGTLGAESAATLKRSKSYQNVDEMEVDSDVVMTAMPIRTAAPQSWWTETLYD